MNELSTLYASFLNAMMTELGAGVGSLHLAVQMDRKFAGQNTIKLDKEIKRSYTYLIELREQVYPDFEQLEENEIREIAEKYRNEMRGWALHLLSLIDEIQKLSNISHEFTNREVERIRPSLEHLLLDIESMRSWPIG